MTGKTRSFEREPLPTYRATCDTCGWEGRPWHIKAKPREEQEQHTCPTNKDTSE